MKQSMRQRKKQNLRQNWLKVWMMVALLLCLTVQPVWAADDEYPIFTEYADGWSVVGPVAYGRNVDGQIFVPLRVLAELVSADVDWQPDTRTVIITRCDGAVLQMGIGKENARITRLGETEQVTMTATRLIKGVTYVPLRFAAENLMYNVMWDNQAKSVTMLGYFASSEIDGKTYTLDFATGELTERTADGKVTLLGQARAADIAQAYQDMNGRICVGWYVRDVRQTAAGNHIVLVDAWVRDSYLGRNMQLWLTDDVQNSRCFYWTQMYWDKATGYSVYIDGDNVWWPEDDAVYKLDADGDVLAEYAYADMLADVEGYSGYGFCFADGEYMLLNAYSTERNGGSAMLLVNMQTGETVDLVDELLSAEEQKQRGFLYSTVEGGGFLRFEKAEDGVLYLTCHYFAADQPLAMTYKYK